MGAPLKNLVVRPGDVRVVQLEPGESQDEQGGVRYNDQEVDGLLVLPKAQSDACNAVMKGRGLKQSTITRMGSVRGSRGMWCLETRLAEMKLSAAPVSCRAEQVSCGMLAWLSLIVIMKEVEWYEPKNPPKITWLGHFPAKSDRRRDSVLLCHSKHKASHDDASVSLLERWREILHLHWLFWWVDSWKNQKWRCELLWTRLARPMWATMRDSTFE